MRTSDVSVYTNNETKIHHKVHKTQGLLCNHLKREGVVGISHISTHCDHRIQEQGHLPAPGG